MIVLPNSFERYLSALRIFVSLSILKRGLKPQHLENLKKIYCAEALYNKILVQSVDINKLCTNLFSAVNTINPDFKFSCRIDGNFYVNKNLFTLFLLYVSKISNTVSVSGNEAFLTVKFPKHNNASLLFLSALGGYEIREIKQNSTLALIPSGESTEASVYIESEWENIFDQFSIVNIFFKNILYP